ncbi:MAG: hypothetical protein LBQ67_06385 [Treponema sp.]|jgi:hypothetical protein|nr:hypothetical protein [Treponema sp.]
MSRKKNELVSRDAAAMDRQQKALEKASELYGDGEPFDVERILDHMEFKSEQVNKNLNDFGRYCLWLKEGIGWGGFVKALESRHFDIRLAYHAMIQFKKFGDNFATVANLGSRKARAITYFTKEEIEKYANGGPLGDIPHDDVTTMTALELEEEVRFLKKKNANQKEQHKQEVEKLKEIIDDLKIRAEDPMQLTPGQKAARELRGLTAAYSIALSKISAGFREAMSILNEGEKIPGIGVQELNEWANEFVPDSANIHELFAKWKDGFENPSPIIDNFFDIIEGKADVSELG